MKTIALDTQPLKNPQKTGHAYYVEWLLAALRRVGRFNYVECTPDHEGDLNTVGRYMWDQSELPAKAKGADLLCTTAFSVPTRRKVGKMKRVAIVHDLALLRFPGNMKGLSGFFLRWFVPRTFKRADHCIAISETTKQDMVELLGIDPAKITVVYSGVDPFFGPSDSKVIRTKLQLPEHYFLFVGTLEPRKNLAFLLEAIADVLKAEQIPLVLVGKRGWQYEELFAKRAELELENLVIEAGYVSDAEKRDLYSGATAFLYPSRYEGFGLPLVEAMACGAPVIGSHVSSIPEVVGDAGVLLPFEGDAWKNAVQNILQPDEQQRLRELGFKRAAEFSWDKTAAGVADVFDRVLES